MPEDVTAIAVVSPKQMILGEGSMEGLTLDEKVSALVRLSEAQAAALPESFIEKELVVMGITPYVRNSVDMETGELVKYNYVAFTLDSGEVFKTASSQALPFAIQVATILGYDIKTGNLTHPIKMFIKPAKAAQGFIYKFVFKGLA